MVYEKINLAFCIVICRVIYRIFLLVFLIIALGACILPRPIESPTAGVNNSPLIDVTSIAEFTPPISEMPLEAIFENIVTAHRNQAYYAATKTRAMMATSPYYSQLPAYQSEYSISIWQDGLGNRRRGRQFGETSLLTETMTCYQDKCASYELMNNIYRTHPDNYFNHEGINPIPIDTAISHYLFSQIDLLKVEEYQIIEDSIEIAGRPVIGLHILGTGDQMFNEVIYWLDTEKWIILAFDFITIDASGIPFRFDEISSIQYDPEFDEDFWTYPTNIQQELHCNAGLGERTFEAVDSIQDAQSLVGFPIRTSSQIPENYELHEVEINRCLKPARNTTLLTYYEADSAGFFVGMLQIQQIDYPAPLPDIGVAVQVHDNSGRLIDSRMGEHILIWVENGQRFMIRGSTEREGITPELLLNIANSLD